MIHTRHLKLLVLAATAAIVAMLFVLVWLHVPVAVSAQPALQQATPTATTTVSTTVGITKTNACGIVISNEVISQTTNVTSTVVTAAPTTTPVTTTAPVSQPAAPTARVLRIGEDVYPAVLDPQRASFVNEFEILTLAYEGLVSVDPQGNVVLAAAEQYEFNATGTVLTFTLRADLKRVDGAAITSKDFASAIKRGMDPCLGGRQYASVLYDIKGAQDVSGFDIDNKTEAELKQALDGVGIHTPDDKTLAFEFAEPVGDYWLYLTSLPIFFPTDTKIAATAPDGWAEVAGNHNGNGPFVIVEFDDGNSITLAANPNYRTGRPKLDRIEFKYNPDTQAQLDAYTKGELDIDAAVSTDLLPQIMSDTLKNEFHQYDGASTYMLAFNSTVKPFDDRVVRTAFSQALDREGFVKAILLGAGAPTTRWIPPGVPGNQADKPGVPASDPQAAVKTLVDNGYGKDGQVDCAKLGAIKFTYPDSPSNKRQVEFLAANLQKVLGCPITPEPVHPVLYTRLVREPKTSPQMTLRSWIEDFPHPQNWLSTYWTCGSFARRYGYCNVALDQTLKHADAASDIESAVKLYQAAEDLLIADVPAAFLYNGVNMQLIKPYVLGPVHNTSPRDAGWIGEWGPVVEYDIDLSKVPDTYPKQ
ncbi:MAG: peptide ABC transporter substrate-binding protein [Chloroflexi bacterium]|nr:peptide ABC transporter substrate-binding protein [Chloroflexota bacterium]